MKNLLLVSIALTLCFSACGQKLKKEDVPAVITAKFKTLYPNIEDVKWSKEDANYEAEFDLNKVETSVVIDASGNALETESEITPAELPATIKEYVKQHYNDAKIKEAAKMVDSKGVTTYEAEVNDADVIFDAKGTFIKEVKEEGEAEVVVPEVVKTKFKSLYPSVEKVKWGKEDANYEAEFDLNKVETSVVFDATGNALETETEISESDLPAAIKTYISTNVPNEKIKEASKMTDAKGIVTYEAEVKGVDYVFDINGKFIKKVEEKDND